MTEYVIRTTRLTVSQRGEPIFAETSTDVTIEDEAGGEFVTVQQKSLTTNDLDQKIAIEPAEWPALRSAIEQLLAACREYK